MVFAEAYTAVSKLVERFVELGYLAYGFVFGAYEPFSLLDQAVSSVHLGHRREALRDRIVDVHIHKRV